MSKILRNALLVYAVAAAALVGFLALSGKRSQADQPSASRADMPLAETLSCTSVDEPVNFLTFGVGDAVEGHQLTHILRRCDKPYPGEPVAANYVSYIYGDCIPTSVGDGERKTCAPPLEIQTWPSCQRSLAEYGDQILDQVKKLPDLQGATRVEIRDRIEIYTLDSTVVIFAKTPELLSTAAKEIGYQPYLESRRWLDHKAQGSAQMNSELSAERSIVGPADSSALRGESKCS